MVMPQSTRHGYFVSKLVTVQNILEDLLDKSEFYKILALRFANFYGLKSRICSGTEQIRKL